MFIFSGKNRSSRCTIRKGQLVPFFIVAIVVIIIAALITVNLGKIARTRTYSSNSSDAGALATGTTLAYALNYLAKATEQMEDNYDNFEDEAQRHYANARDLNSSARTNTSTAHSYACDDPDTALVYAQSAKAQMVRFRDEANLLRDEDDDNNDGYADGIVPNYHDHQQEFYERIRSIVHDDEDHQDDLYNNALVAGYKFNFLNSGLGVKMGEATSRDPYGKVDFHNYIDELTFEENVCDEQASPWRFRHSDCTVENNEEKYIAWDDMQEREHKVKAKIKVDPLRTYDIRHTEDDYGDVIDNLDETYSKSLLAISRLNSAIESLGAASNAKADYEQCMAEAEDEDEEAECDTYYQSWQGNCEDAKGYLMDNAQDNAYYYEGEANDYIEDARDGWQLNTQDTYSSTTETDTDEDDGDLLIAYIYDLDHDRLVESYQTQEHEDNTGEDSADLWETEYPDITSSAKATFNFECRGQVYETCNGGMPDGPVALHEAGLTEVDFHEQSTSSGTSGNSGNNSGNNSGDNSGN